MYQIKEFSKLSNTSVQTLRYYDNLNLLKPEKIGEYNNYRYYTKRQIEELIIIKKLKKMGFKLNEIKKILKEYNSKYLHYRKTELEKQIKLNIKSIEEIDKIIEIMRTTEKNFADTIIELINMKRKENKIMKDKYDILKNNLMECFDLFHSDKYDDFIIKVEEMKNMIFDSSNELDPFWLDTAGNLFSGITYEMIKNNPKNEVNFINLFHFRIKGVDYIDNLLSYSEKLEKDSFTSINLIPVAKAPINTQESILSVFRQKIHYFAVLETKK